MAQATAQPQKGQRKGQKQGQKQGPDYLGHGNYTKNMLASWSSIEKRLLARGHKQAELDFIYAVAVCPKGHDDHLNQTAAAKKFFPGVSPVTAKCRVLNCLLDFSQQTFAGQHVEKYQAVWDEAHAKPVSKGTRPRLSIEEKATRIATHDLKVAFRESEGVGGRGRLKPEVQEKLDRYVEKHLPNAIKKVTADLEG